MKPVSAHDQVIFATPIYWYAVSPAMKVFLDRFSDLLELLGLLSEGRRQLPTIAEFDAARVLFSHDASPRQRLENIDWPLRAVLYELVGTLENALLPTPPPQSVLERCGSLKPEKDGTRNFRATGRGVT